MSWLLLSSDCIASKPSLFPTLPLQCTGHGRTRVKGHTTRTDDPDWPKRYSVPCNAMFSNKKLRDWVVGKVGIA